MKNPNRYGTCYKLSGKRRNPYIARAYSGKDEYGKPIYQTIGYFKTKSEGLRALRDYNINPYDIANTKLTLLDVFNLFKEYQQKYIKEDSFKSNYEGPFFVFFDSIKDEIFKDLRPLHYQKIIDELSKTHKKTYLNKFKNLLRMIYQFALMQDIIDKDYSMGVKIIGKESNEQDYFTDIEVAKMIKNLGKVENVDMILMLCLKGLRPSELLGITKFNLDFKNNMISGIGIKTQAGKNKKIPISKILLPYLKQRYNSTDDYLYKHPKGSKMDYFYFLDYIYKPCLKELQIPYKSPKAGRHFFATITKQEQVNDKARKTMIGHTNAAFTDERYTHTMNKFLQTEYNKIEQHFINIDV